MLALIPATLGGPLDLLARALVFLVFTAGALAALAGLLGRAPAGPRAPIAQVAYASFSGIVAALLAVQLGGPGALVWLVLACLAGAAIHKIEARQAGASGPEDRSSGPASTSLAAAALRVGHAVAVVLLTLAAGALLLAHQAAELSGAVGPVLPWACGLALAAATFLAVRGDHDSRGGRWLGPLTLISLGLHVALCLSLLAGGAALGPVLADMFRAAFTADAALAGGLAAAAQGVLRAAASGAVGGLSGPRPDQRGAWGEPLVVAAVALLTGLAGLVVGAIYDRWGKPIRGGNNLVIDTLHDDGAEIPLRMAPMVLLGTLSYSLYLWQQVFLDRDAGHAWVGFPLNVLLAIAVACASYYLLERPLLDLRRRLAGAAVDQAP